jgi:hypothetical protein
MASRPTPFDLALAELADARFAGIAAGLEAAAADPLDRDAFLMTPEAVQAVRDLRPDEGLGEGIAELAALLHHAFLFWAGGRRVVAPGRSTVERALDAPRDRIAPGGARYVQLPPRLVWAEAVAGVPAEPLDGFFVHPLPAGLRALGVLGLQPGRPGVTVVEVEGPCPRELVRPDGTPLFSPVLAGGGPAGLRSLTGGEEFLELAWRLGASA